MVEYDAEMGPCEGKPRGGGGGGECANSMPALYSDTSNSLISLISQRLMMQHA